MDADNDEKIGYLIAKVEEISYDVRDLKLSHNELQKRVDDKFKTAQILFRVAQGLGGIIIAVLTLKFGDVKVLWEIIRSSF